MCFDSDVYGFWEGWDFFYGFYRFCWFVDLVIVGYWYWVVMGGFSIFMILFRDMFGFF